MKKVLTHNGKQFNLHLTFNHNVERRMDGKVEHLLASFGIGDDNKWNKSWMIDNSKMKEQIEEAEQQMKDFADGKALPQYEQIAGAMGFN